MTASNQTAQTAQSTQAPQTAQASELRRFMSDGLILALTVVVGYLWTLSYEAGVCNYFYIPFAFISLNQANVLLWSAPQFIVVIIISAVFGLIMYFSYWLSRRIDRYASVNPRREIYAMIISVVVFSIVYAFILTASGDDFLGKLVAILVKIVMGVMLASIIIRWFIWPIFTQRGAGGYWERLIADVSSRRARASQSPSLSPRVWDICVVGVLFYLVVGGIYAGFSTAMKSSSQQGWLQVIPAENQRPEVAVVRVYGDYLLTVPFDRTTKEFEKRLYILKISEMAEVPLTYEKVGPLKVKPDGGLQGSQTSP